MQQPADRFCKAILPEQHRLEAPILALRQFGSAQAARVVQQQRHDVESVASAGANPAVSTIFRPASIKVMQRTFNP